MKLAFFLITLFSIAKSFACPERQYQVKAHHRSGYIRYDGVVVKDTFVSAYCKDYSAAYLYVKDMFNDNAPKDWPHKEISKSWTEGERQRVIEAIENVPEILKIPGLKKIQRMAKSKNFPNPSTSAPEVGYIVLYDSAFSNDLYKNKLDRILNHELSHLQFESLEESDKLDYGRETGWIYIPNKNKPYWIPRRDRYVEEDGKLMLEEDYANNFEYYLYEPDKLKSVTPKAHNWIKRHFGNQLILPRKKK